MTVVFMTRWYKYVRGEAKRKYDESLLRSPCTVNFLSWIFCIKPAQTGCGPFEEDASTTLTCGSSCASGESLSWRADIDTVSATVAQCQGNACGVFPAYSNYFSISPTGSTLTINSVSRSVPFNTETRWTCQCGGAQNTVCGRLQVYGQLLFAAPHLFCRRKY